jgi:AmmeMemoRadiSam system protein A
MAGTFEKLNVDSKEYSHEDITGVGYGICSFYPQDENKERNFYEQYLTQEENRVISKDELVNLAKKTIENYIIKEEIIKVPENVSEEITKNKAGVFVSLHKFGELRGCIGTFLPTKESIAEEIIRNAIAAATEDYRFNRVTEEVLKYLEINVDVLSEPVPVESIDELDAKKYGVIVYSGIKRGLLLPDIEGVDTVEQQINIARQKGSIEPNEEITIEKFEVVRHK